MTQENQLQKLEQFVEKLLQKFNQLKAENTKLELELKERSELIEEMQGNLDSKDSERSEIRSRVNKLVEQFEEWELGLDDVAESEYPEADEEVEGLEDEEPPYTDTQEDESGELEDDDLEDELEEDDEPAKTVDEEGRVQHNLFSMSGGPKDSGQ